MTKNNDYAFSDTLHSEIRYTALHQALIDLHKLQEDRTSSQETKNEKEIEILNMIDKRAGLINLPTTSNPKHPLDSETTPLLMAINWKMTEIALNLIEKGADLNYQDLNLEKRQQESKKDLTKDLNALHLAIDTGQFDLVFAMIEKKERVGASSEQDLYPEIYARRRRLGAFDSKTDAFTFLSEKIDYMNYNLKDKITFANKEIECAKEDLDKKTLTKHYQEEISKDIVKFYKLNDVCEKLNKIEPKSAELQGFLKNQKILSAVSTLSENTWVGSPTKSYISHE